MDYFEINMETAIDIIKKLLKEEHITIDEFVTLYDAIKPSVFYHPYYYPYYPFNTPGITYTTNDTENDITG